MLLIDRGNTRLKWQLWDQGLPLKTGVALQEEPLVHVFKDLNSDDVSNIYVSSVVGHVFEQELKDWAAQSGFSVPVFVCSVESICGVTNGYDKPRQLGVDRWLAMIAAFKQYSGLLCVVDSGTALTIDFISSEGQHLGGFIVPGQKLMEQSLLANTHKISVTESLESSVFGTNTTQAVSLGTWGVLGAFINHKVSEVNVAFAEPVKVILTGGAVEPLVSLLQVDHCYQKDLVLKGLALVVGEKE